jgi:hypothetical protein
VRNENETTAEVKDDIFQRIRDVILHWYGHIGGMVNLRALDTLVPITPSKKLEKPLGCMAFFNEI